MSRRALLPALATDPPRNRRLPRPAPPRPDWLLQSRAVHESIGLVLAAVFVSASLYWLLALR
jgi:hypothetical protein